MGKLMLVQRLVHPLLLLIICCLPTSTVLGVSVLDKDEQQRRQSSETPLYYDIRMPGVTASKTGQYVRHWQSTHFKTDMYVTKLEPLDAVSDIVHHMFLMLSTAHSHYQRFRLDVNGSSTKRRDSHPHPHPHAHNAYILAWAKNAPALSLPPHVAIEVPAGASLGLEVHYSNGGIRNYAGVRLHLAPRGYTPNFLAGILFIANRGGRLRIPYGVSRSSFHGTCWIGGIKKPMFIFAVRVHSHLLGTVITAHKLLPSTRTINGSRYEEIIKGNPMWPQGFYPLQEPYPVYPNDVLLLQCVYNSTQAHVRETGGDVTDEMCNLYLMYYLDIDDSGLPLCYKPTWSLPSLPANSLEPPPKNETLEAWAWNHPHPVQALAAGYNNTYNASSTGVVPSNDDGRIDP